MEVVDIADASATAAPTADPLRTFCESRWCFAASPSPSAPIGHTRAQPLAQPDGSGPNGARRRVSPATACARPAVLKSFAAASAVETGEPGRWNPLRPPAPPGWRARGRCWPGWALRGRRRREGSKVNRTFSLSVGEGIGGTARRTGSRLARCAPQCPDKRPGLGQGGYRPSATRPSPGLGSPGSLVTLTLPPPCGLRVEV